MLRICRHLAQHLWTGFWFRLLLKKVGRSLGRKWSSIKLLFLAVNFKLYPIKKITTSGFPLENFILKNKTQCIFPSKKTHIGNFLMLPYWNTVYWWQKEHHFEELIEHSKQQVPFTISPWFLWNVRSKYVKCAFLLYKSPLWTFYVKGKRKECEYETPVQCWTLNNSINKLAVWNLFIQ